MNNAGLSYDHPEYLADIDDHAVHDMLNINALVPVMVSPLRAAQPGARAGCPCMRVGEGQGQCRAPTLSYWGRPIWS